ncbi:hypothetical protein KIPE111705_06820 [Kibdelosporangium persicum]|uniref:Sigma-70 family RNA polymerase sigma factor n=1 Tax=Kibdelosporangium persicum TaxID=2698649 RepID=A0ABX2F4E9_9PSEU|nr:hypothetical protein [Kibdelosporangium persicum]NRN65728.1 Sigma-70 family RNA polymerase sigma factor [Kibdelosporangium persicum]
MAPNHKFSRAPFEHDSLPLDSARTAFEWLVTEPEPLSIDGRYFPGLPRRRVPLDELRDLLLEGTLPMPAVDLIWMHLVTRSRDEGGAWTVACVGVALPALLSIAAELCAPYADDRRDIHAAVLTGFLSELASIDLARPWVLWRLRCAALRAGHLFIRDALERPLPSDEDFHSSEPTPPWGHPDFVLARAVAEGAITREEAELIGSTRLEDYSLSAAAADAGVNVTTLQWVRGEAEARLVAWLTEQAPHDDPGDRRERDVEIRAVNAATITAAANGTGNTLRRPAGKSRRVTTSTEKLSVTVRYRTWKTAPQSGVEGCGRTSAAPAHTTSPDRPSAPAPRPSGTTPEVPRCA